MEEVEYQVMAQVEDTHFWFVGTRGMVRDCLLAASLPPNPKILDLGCGTGGTMKALAGLGDFVGLDMSEEAVRLATKRTGNPCVIGTADHIPFDDATFDALLALDVFEHIPDDLAAVREARRVLKMGGALIATVPCHPWLFSEHDRALHHVRRYTRSGFLTLLGEASFRPQRVTYTNTFLFPAVAMVRTFGRLRKKDSPASDAQMRLGPLNGILSGIFQFERRLLRHMNMPFGLSLLVLAR